MITKTINFLPEVFRTPANQKFLNATLDQLVSEPNFKQLNGYIGRKFAPTFKVTDNYLPEPSADRQNYQLEPSVTVTDEDGNLKFFSSYMDLIQQIKNYGGVVDNHSRLFTNEAYTFDGKVDFDKLVNFSQYYWLPGGPAPVDVFSGDVDDIRDFIITRDSADQSYKVEGFDNEQNPDLTVARGGTYRFIVRQSGEQPDGAVDPQFWIQTNPGIDGIRPGQNNVNTRDVLGVVNNGATNGVITFNVPQENAQDFYTGMPLVQVETYIDENGYERGKNVDLATSLRFIDIDNRSVNNLINTYGGIDGISNNLNGKYLIFVGNHISDEAWDEWSIYGINGYDSTAYDDGHIVPVDYRTDIWQIQYVDTGDGDVLINLVRIKDIPTNNKVFVKSGFDNANKEFYKQESTGDMVQVPLLSSTLDTLFYNDSINQRYYGRIIIVPKPTYYIHVLDEIIGKKTYTSPNGVKFTNGLKIRFGSLVKPESYANKVYYVEGVGKSIRLVKASHLITPELDYNGASIPFDIYGFSDDLFDEMLNGPLYPDYMSINRSSVDYNAWSRSNRWFHADVIAETAKYNGAVAQYDQSMRAQRPIIEFNPDMLLYNSGRIAKHDVDVIDFTVTDALNEVERDVSYFRDTRFKDGMTVIFANDFDPIVRNKIWKVNILFVNKTEFDDNNNPKLNPDTGEPISHNGEYRVIDGDNPDHIPVYTLEDISDEDYARLVLDSQGKPIFDLYRRVHLTRAEDYEIEANNCVAPKAGITVTLEQFNTALAETLKYNPSSRRLSESNGIGYIPLDGVISENVGLVLSKSFWFNGTSWVLGQQKPSANIPPRFDLIDSDGVSFADVSKYNDSSFIGNKIFAYTPGNGPMDSVLGFALSYRNFGNMGDIQFTNHVDSDTFTSKVPPITNTYKCNSGFIAHIVDRTELTKENIWLTNTEMTKQYQVISGICDGFTSHFEIDIQPDFVHLVPNTKVYLNNRLLDDSEYVYDSVGVRKTIRITTFIQYGDRVDILIFSSTVSNIGYYEIPLSLDFNALNANFLSLTLGQFRNHLAKIASNSTEVIGQVPGNSNFRDIDIKARGGTILQHSAPAVYGSLFVINKDINYIDAITQSQKEYSRFKNRFLEAFSTAVDNNLSEPRLGTDFILANLNFAKNSQSAWYYSDMIPYGENKTLIEYVVLDVELTEYEIDAIFNDKQLSNKAVLVYLNGKQLIKGINYEFNQTRQSVIFLDTLNYDDIIQIYIYHNTDGCYIPETPSKLGLYPAFVPERYLDSTYSTPVEVIRGHDGSITPVFGDLRDDLLLELEKRIYNNIKAQYITQYFDIYDHIPGKFRDTDYNRDEYNRILTRCFLSWVGNNRVDYATNHWFSNGNPWSWSYRRAKDIIDKEFLPGYWRGIYHYFYDTDAPNYRPWEMLGFSNRPDWWVEEYGPAPYTGGNMVLWEDLEQGVIRRGPRAGTYAKYARPGLLKVIPVTDTGELRPPSDFMLASFNGGDFSGAFTIGDEGPVETAWRRSSDYPFAMQQALALMKPGIYFGSLASIQSYYRFETDGQFMVTGSHQRIKPSDFKINGENINGTIVRNAGYLNWVADYITNNGALPAQTIRGYLDTINVQLAYRVGGFTDQNYLKVLAEQSSPSSTNDSIMLPNENYVVHLHKSSPVSKAIYSAVIVEKTTAGYTVSGYNTQLPYFTIIPSEPNNNYYTIEVLKASGIIYNDYQKYKLTVPYGYEFKNKQQVIDFLISYQRYLKSQGFLFDEFNQELHEAKTWELSAKEYLTWVQQNWGPGSIIVLSPVANVIKLNAYGSVVDEVNNHPNGSKILDINFNVIKQSLFTIIRDDSRFEIGTSENVSIGLLVVNLVQYEHALVFDNETMFKDIIYKPELGNRQYRLKLIGNKTNQWTGQLNPPGFIFSKPTLDKWSVGKDYRKGDIVVFKGLTYTALENVDATEYFNFGLWKQLDKGAIATGLLPNFAYNAKKFENMYDVDNLIQDQNINVFSNALIGHKERDYLSDLSLSSTSQVKFYQGFIKDKGTKAAVTALTGATFNNLGGTVEFNEEWAFRVGEYGALESNQFLEVQLSDTKYTTTPMTFSLLNYGESVTDVNIVGEYKSTLYKTPTMYKTNIFDNRSNTSIYEHDISNAGYVNLNDIDATIFDMQNYVALNSLLREMRNGYRIWAAKDTRQAWNVYRVMESNNIVTEISYDGAGQAKVTTRSPHKLIVGDIFAIRNFSEIYDGFYRVFRVDDLDTVAVTTTATVDQALTDLLTADDSTGGTAYGSGSMISLSSMRVDHLTALTDLSPLHGWRDTDKVWVDNDVDGKWGVYQKQLPWDFKTTLQRAMTNDIDHEQDFYGHCVATSPDGGIVTVSAPGAIGNNLKVFARLPDGSYLETVGEQTIVRSIPYLGAPAGVYDYELVNFENEYDPLLTVGNTVAMSYSTIVSTIKTSDITKQDAIQILTIDGAPNVVTKDMIYDTTGITITAVALTNPGSGYTAPPTLTITNGTYRLDTTNPTVYNDTGSGLTLQLIGEQVGPTYLLYEINVLSYGSGYKVAPTVTISGNAEVTMEIARGDFGKAISVTKDNQWMFVTAPGNAKIQCYKNMPRATVIDFTAPTVFTPTQTIIGPPNTDFGSSLAANADGTKIAVGAPYSDSTVNTVFTPNVGAVYVFERDSTAILFGTDPTQLIAPPELDNSHSNFGYAVAFTNYGKDLLISAPGYATETIRNGVVYRYEFNETTMLFAQTDVINKPFNAFIERFGSEIAANEDNKTILISGYGADTISEMVIDHETVYFDGGNTTFYDRVRGSGSVYVYDLMTSAVDQQYMFTQQLARSGISPRDNFGASIAIANNVMVVGSPLRDINVGTELEYDAGNVALFTNPTNSLTWTRIREQEPKVDLHNYIRMYLYNRKTQVIASGLDYIDPCKGKILGVVDQDITYKTSFDPAKYNIGFSTKVTVDPNQHWGVEQVGQVWWNMDLVRYIDYEQSNLTYRIQNWGKLFPGSTVEVLEWVESYYPPSAYTGEGTPKYPDDSAYVEYINVDQVTGMMQSKYYFWVKDKETFDRSLSFRRAGTRAIADIISNPTGQQIPFAAIVKDNTISIFNSNKFIASDEIVLHIDYDLLNNENLIHNEYELIQEDSSETILPRKIVNKFIDSITGEDTGGNVVPDPALKESERYGISIRPRQSMTVNKLNAAQNLVQYVNGVFMLHPIAEQSDLSKLFLADPIPAYWDPSGINLTVENLEERSYLNLDALFTGQLVLVLSDSDFYGQWSIYETRADKTFRLSRTQSYRTTDYWSYTDWFDPAFDPSVIPTFTVDTIKDMAKLRVTGDDVIWVKDNGSGKFAVFYINDDLTATLVGIQNGTIQLSDALWSHGTNKIGFSNDSFDSVKFDLNPTIEFRNIINALKDDIFINTLDGEFTRMFFVVLNYILSEQVNVDWVLKTSFVSVVHRLRKLDQFPNYIKDNQSFYESYINEVKPYRTKIREYLINYEGSDFAGMYATDFDLPSYYDPDFNIWRSPNNEHARDQLFLTTYPQYADWNANHSYYIDSVVVESPGYRYSAPPTLTVVGGGGSGAVLDAIVDYYSGSLIKVIVKNPGTGYTSTPTIVVAGDGTELKYKVDATAVTGSSVLTSDLYFTDTEIFVEDVSKFSVPTNEPGIVMINDERIMFYAINTDNNSLIQLRRHAWGSGTPQIHLAGSTVIDIGVFETVQTARCYPIMKNTTVRSFDTVIKFDRVAYRSDITDWRANTVYTINDRFAYQGKAYKIRTQGASINSGLFFNPSEYVVIDAADPTLNAMDRTLAYYKPSDNMLPKDLKQLFTGVDYPGNIVDGSTLVDETQDTNIQSYLNDMELGTRPEDINIDSHGFIDVFSSHAPEELLPGRVYDTLDIQVYTVDIDNPEDAPMGFRVIKTLVDERPTSFDHNVVPESNTRFDGWETRFDTKPDAWEFRRICAAATTTLALDLMIGDTEIFVTDVDRLPIPNTELAYPGVIFINGEKITYYTINKAANSLGQIRRGTWGTGAPMVHRVGSRVVDASLNQKIPGDALGMTWLDSDVGDINNDMVEDIITGSGLRAAQTPQAVFIRACPSFLPSLPGDDMYVGRVDPNASATRFSDNGMGEYGVLVTDIPDPALGDPTRVRSVGIGPSGEAVHGFDIDDFDSYDEG